MKFLKTLVLSASIAVTGAAYADGEDYVLSTASTGGTYHPVGTAIATLSKI